MNYFFGILAQVSGERYSKNPLISVRRFDDLGFVTMEFRKRDDAEICLFLDGTEYSSGYKMRIVRVKRFIEQWNDEVGRGRNPAMDPFGFRVGGIGKSNFSGLDDSGIDFHKGGHRAEGGADEDNRIFMGGIPFTMTEPQVREVCEAFGRLKQFNLIKDPQNPMHNKGYAFFEYQDERAAEKAIKHLNNLEIRDKKLKV